MNLDVIFVHVINIKSTIKWTINKSDIIFHYIQFNCFLKYIKSFLREYRLIMNIKYM